MKSRRLRCYGHIETIFKKKMRRQIVNVRMGQRKEVNDDKGGLMMWKRMGRKVA